MEMFGDRAARLDEHELDEPTARGPGCASAGGSTYRGARRRRVRAPPARALGRAGAGGRPARARGAAASVSCACPWLDGPTAARGVGRPRARLVRRARRSTRRASATRYASGSRRASAWSANGRLPPRSRGGRRLRRRAVVSGCPEPPHRRALGRRRDLLPGILHVTPTSLDAWRRCPREWRDQYLFDVPASDGDPGGVHGQQLHDMLGHIHEKGSCHDAVHVDDVLAAARRRRTTTGCGARSRNHVRRCPDPARSRRPRDHARAVPSSRCRRSWRRRASTRCGRTTACSTRVTSRPDRCGATSWHTTSRPGSRRSCSRRSRRLRGLRLRIAFEHLAAEVVDDPEPFEPDADDLLAIEEELRLEVAEIRTERVRRRRRRGGVRALPVPFDLPRLGGAGRAGVAGGRRRRRLGARPMPATPTRLTRGRMMWWGFTKRCPRCGSGHLFRRWFTIVDDCPRCGLHFEREQGYWAGALAINIGIAAVVFVVVFAVGLVLTVPDIPVRQLLAMLVPADDHRADRLVPVLEDDLGGRRPRAAPAHGPARAPRRTDLRTVRRAGRAARSCPRGRAGRRCARVRRAARRTSSCRHRVRRRPSRR